MAQRCRATFLREEAAVQDWCCSLYTPLKKKRKQKWLSESMAVNMDYSINLDLPCLSMTPAKGQTSLSGDVLFWKKPSLFWCSCPFFIHLRATMTFIWWNLSDFQFLHTFYPQSIVVALASKQNMNILTSTHIFCHQHRGFSQWEIWNSTRSIYLKEKFYIYFDSPYRLTHMYMGMLHTAVS